MTSEQLRPDNSYGDGQLPKNPTKIQQLEYELGEEFLKALNDSKVNEILETYGLTGEEVVKFKVVIDLHKVQKTSDASISPELKTAFKEIPGFDFTLQSCCLRNGVCVRW